MAAVIADAAAVTFSASALARARISAASSSASRIIRCIRFDSPVIETGSCARLSSWVRSSSTSDLRGLQLAVTSASRWLVASPLAVAIRRSYRAVPDAR